ncbi:MAG: hypothetical protein WCF67_02290 [Chitinophagaceae bacterium]
MQQTLVKLAYKQVIDKNAVTAFERDVYNDTYNEFLMQVQAYNPDFKYKTLEEVIAANPKAQSLHYKVGFSIGLYIKGLNNRIPGLKDTLGRSDLTFESHAFELVASDVTNPSVHTVAITYTTGALTLLGVYGEYLLLTKGELSTAAQEEGVDAFMIRLQENMSIVHFRQAE